MFSGKIPQNLFRGNLSNVSFQEIFLNMIRESEIFFAIVYLTQLS